MRGLLTTPPVLYDLILFRKVWDDASSHGWASDVYCWCHVAKRFDGIKAKPALTFYDQHRNKSWCCSTQLLLPPTIYLKNFSSFGTVYLSDRCCPKNLIGWALSMSVLFDLLWIINKAWQKWLTIWNFLKVGGQTLPRPAVLTCFRWGSLLVVFPYVPGKYFPTFPVFLTTVAWGRSVIAPLSPIRGRHFCVVCWAGRRTLFEWDYSVSPFPAAQGH